MQDNQIHLGCRALARALSQVIGRPVSEKQAGDWARKGLYRTKKVGHFRSATTTTIREDFTPETSSSTASPVAGEQCRSPENKGPRPSANENAAPEE